ncbi:MAG: hypothetical protein ACRBG0_19370 [Lewinella sp.]|uniref:hypothetical protein n=1 Tax=Lewinella sp. TaxID=2004506 RepID=UPI003D6C58C7
MKDQHLYSGGTSQTDRTISNFALDNLAIDGKSDADFFNFIFDFARSVAFWNENNLPNGDWQRFFAGDVTFLLATIREKDLTVYPKQLHKLITDYELTPLDSEKEYIQVQVLQLILGISQYLTTWSSHVQAFNHSTDHKTAVQKSIDETLQSNIWPNYRYLRDCIQAMIYLYRQNPNNISHENLAVKTSKIQDALAGILYQKYDPKSGTDSKMAQELSSYQGIWKYLLRLYESLYRTLAALKKQVELYIDESFAQSDHAPQVALLFSLLEMMAPLKKQLNGFSIKHLDFYYRQVLLQQVKAGKPDSVPVHFVGKVNYGKSHHPVGTPLVANIDASDAPIIYHTTKPLTVTGALPVAFKTVYNGQVGLPIMQAAHEYVYAAPIANSLDGQGAKLTAEHPSWPTLGSSLTALPVKVQEERLAELGWAISSSLLLLAEGQRTLQLFWELPANTFDTLANQLQKLGLNKSEEALPLFLQSVFEITYTAPKSWKKVTSVKIELSDKSIQQSTKSKPPIDTKTPSVASVPKTGLLFTLLIAPTKPSVVAYLPKIHKGNYQTDQPILRFALKQKVALPAKESAVKTKKKIINPYALLKGWSLKQGSLQISVKGIQTFAFQNDFSLLKPNAPITPFGVKPLQGNHFYLGNTEVFGKPLSSLSLEIEWYDLPQMKYGFCQYYESYNKTFPKYPFFNSAFKWNAALLLDQSWQPLPFIIEPIRALKPVDAQTLPSTETTHPLTGSTTKTAETEITPKPTSSVKKDHSFFHLLDNIEGRVSHLLDHLQGKHHTTELPQKRTEETPSHSNSKASPPTTKPPHEQKSLSIHTQETYLFSWKKLKIASAPIPSPKKHSSSTSTNHSSSTESSFHKDAHKALGHLQQAVNALRTKGEELLSAQGLVPGLRLDLLKWLSNRATKKVGAAPQLPKRKTSSSPPKKEPGAKKNNPVTMICPHLDEGKLKSTSTFQLAVEHLKWPSRQEPLKTPPSPLKYSEHSKSGFLRLELTNPPYAFGHEEYARVVAEIANENMSTIAHMLSPNSPRLLPDPDKKKEKDSTNSNKIKTPTGQGNSIKKIIVTEVNHLASSISPLAGWLLKEGEKNHVIKKLKAVRAIVKKHKQAEQQKKKGAKNKSQPLKNLDTENLLLPPRPAYTPKIKGITVDYEAHINFTIGTTTIQPLELFHLCPFDTQKALTSTPSARLLPQYPETGYLYMGLEKVNAPEKLTLLFELNESTGDRDLILPTVQWAYYTDEKWTTFPALAVQDGTNSFTESGIVELSLPPVIGPPPFKPSTTKEPAIYWLRASVDQYAAAVCETIQVYPHATLAKRSTAIQPQVEKPLTPSTLQPKQIKKMQQTHPAITKVIQPVSSRGGSVAENTTQMYVRVSEHLRHKGRAITAWDYERLVLQEFPDIGFVRCLNHTSNQSTIAPGHLNILILPTKLPKTNDRLTPKTSPGLRLGISRFLEGITDPFATINVKNPSYDYLKVEVEVQLRPGSDEGQILNSINKKLVNTIAAWAIEPWSINPFTHSCSYYSLLSCVNQEVDIIEIVHFAINLHYGSPTEPPVTIPATFELIPHSSPRSILTSVGQHRITSASHSSQSDIKKEQDKTPPIPKPSAEKTPAAQPHTIPPKKDNLTQTTKTTTPTSMQPVEKKPDNALFIHSNWYNNESKD